MKDDIYIKNRKAKFEFELLEEMVAGIVLQGTEIKSIREGQASINEAFCQFIKNELYVVNMNIAEYKYGTYANHEPKRQRKLLVHANEIKKWSKKVNEKGLTIVPTALFINEKGLAKLKISLAQGKKLYDKRDNIKEKDNKRQLDRLKKMGR
ncbi:MAG: SsrA-binding protein SmpB [Flavobacteriales bacterium]|nr:SsrA-binding protein SmpB [Flavobacteriales bacterium]